MSDLKSSFDKFKYFVSSQKKILKENKMAAKKTDPRVPLLAKGRVKTGTDTYWCNLDESLYKALKPDAVIPLYMEKDLPKKFIKSYTEWEMTVEQYIKQLDKEDQ